MIHKVKLKVRDEERLLTSIEYGYRLKFSDVADIDKIVELHQAVSMKIGSTESLPLEGGLFRVRFSSTDHDHFFYDWMFTSAMQEGSIEFLQNEVETISRINFWDCYCVGIEEWMSAGGAPMGIELLLSPAIVKKDALVHEKVWKITDIHGNTEEVKVEENTKKEDAKPVTPPKLLVTAVKGESSALPNTIVEYKVTNYNLPNVNSDDKARIKWMVKVGEKEFPQKIQGETLKLTIDEAWEGKDLIVMPYLKKYTPSVSVKTKIEKWYFPRVIIQTKTKEGFGNKADRGIFEYEDCHGKGLTPKSTQIAVDMHYGNGVTHTDNFTLSKIKDINVLKNLQYVNSKYNDAELFNQFKELIKLTSRGPLEANNIGMINRIEQKISSDYRSKILTYEVFARERTVDFVKAARKAFVNEIKFKNGNLNKSDFKARFNTQSPIIRPSFPIKEDNLNGLTIALNDTWGFRVTVEKYTLNLDKKECIAKLRYRVFDHFGLDVDDIISYGTKEKIVAKLGLMGGIIENITIPYDQYGYPVRKQGLVTAIAEEVSRGFCAWFILQHFRGYKPFVTIMEEEETIKINI